MKKNKLFVIVFLGLLLTSLTSCIKEGPEGPAGKDGKDGNANVFSSTITSSSWIYNDPVWVIIFAYPAITQDIIDNGAVLVYIKVGNGYNQLPLTFYQSSSYSTTLEVSTYVGGLSIFWSDSDLTQPANPGTQTFKIVVIEAYSLSLNLDVNLSNYEEVKDAFNIVE